MFEPKPISTASIGRALAKAERYRLLNEPREAESICRDILLAAPGHPEATVLLLLALTDQFGRVRGVRMEHATEALDAIADPYTRAYYAGVIAERWAKACL
ncbi:MAG: hypothetical protein KDA25_02365, partial [Phycisphaerales bacterium]|nr:hypothetical protein [Phycisphaerales bacterium]